MTEKKAELFPASALLFYVVVDKRANTVRPYKQMPYLCAFAGLNIVLFYSAAS